MTRNTVLRLAVFFVGIPVLALSAFLGRDAGLPLLGVLIIGATALAAREAALFFPADVTNYAGSSVTIPVIGALVPTIGYLTSVLAPRAPDLAVGPSAIVIAALTVVVAIVMTINVFGRRDESFSGIVGSVAAHLFLLVYPGLFAWHAARIITLPMNSELLLLFFLAVYLNDSMAWVFGKLFGGILRRPGAPPPVAVSPNKSLIGFIGGFLASPAIVVIASIVFPTLLPGAVWRRVLFGMIIGVTSIVGDLVESGLKRSAAVKDSGQLIPGRGGLLDSIDSPLFTAPFFYYGYVILFTL